MSEAEDLRILREIAEKRQKEKQAAGLVSLLLFALLIGWCAYAGNNVEAEKKWCREASAKEFVEQFEARCSQYRSDPAIKYKIERIMAGKDASPFR